MPSLPGPLRSPKNLVALAFGFFLALTFWRFSNSDSSHAHPRNSETPPPTDSRELDHMEHAIRLARAWHVRSTGRLNAEMFQTEEDVMCPSDSHTITRALTPSGPGEITEEFISTASTLYARENGQPWRSEPDPSPEKCEHGPSAGSQKLIPLLDSVKQIARITEGPLIKVGDKSCRIWQLSGASNLPFHSICVEDGSTLPLRLQIGGLLIEYSNWNQPAVIEAPEMPRQPAPQ